MAEHIDNHHHFTVEIVYFSEKYMVTLRNLAGTPIVGIGSTLPEAIWWAVQEREADFNFHRCVSA